MKRILSLVMALAMLFSLLPMPTLASDADHTHSYTAETTAPNCTEQGYTTYTCDCGDSYRTPWLDETAYNGKTIACVGDSITAGHGVTKDENDYVKLLSQQLGMDYIRLGVSGTTLCTDGSRTCNIIRLTEAYLQGADVVTIAMGINDFCAAGVGYYELGDINSTDSSTIYGAARIWCERIAELRKTDSLKDTQFYFVTPVIASWNNSVTNQKNWDQSKTNIHGYTLRDLCNAIIEVAALYDVAVIDLNLVSGMYYVDAQDNNTAEFGGDGVHPGATGHSMMASAIANALLQNYLRDDHTHTYGSWITTTWPTCSTGEQQRVCTVCCATECRSIENHNYDAVVTAPNCTEQGYTTYTCTLCGESTVDSYMDATGHNYEKGICTACGMRIPEPVWELGTIASATGMDNTSNSRLRTIGYHKLTDFAGVSIGQGYTMTNFVYDESYTYLGTSSWIGEGIPFTTAELIEKFPTGVYFRVVFRALDQRALSLEAVADSGAKFYLTEEEVPEPDLGFAYEDVAQIGTWQDGAIWDGKLFVLGAAGTGAVFDVHTGTRLGTLKLDGSDVLMPHANSVCFGSTYYAAGDKYPLLYVNIYNNYASAEDRMEGTCCVYRITESENGFTTDLVQIIRIGFTEDLTLWKSKENNGDVRPYGNFVVDTDKDMLYAFVMRDANKTTRFFGFDIPRVDEGTYNESYGCNVVILETDDIRTQFDSEHYKYLQGCCYSSGKILYVGDFGGDAPLYVVDLDSQKVTDILCLGYLGLRAEPEVICVDPSDGTLYYAAADGVLRMITLENTHFHSYETTITIPTCTQQGYTTYTCDCGASYVDDYVDATGHAYENGTCAGCGDLCDVGDVNGDGMINTQDPLRLMKYLAGYDVEIALDLADVNGDGKINTQDSLRLMKYLAGWDVTLVSWPKQQILNGANLRAFPIKSSSMTTAQLRNLCVDFFRFSKTALWKPDESISFYRSDAGGLDSMTAGVWYGGLPYVGLANGNVYRLMDYLDENTGIVDMSDALNLTGDTLTREDMEYFGNQCANGVHQGWARVINSVNGTITAYATKNRGYIPLGEYTYDYAKIDYWQNADGYRTSDVVEANGKQTMYRSYAQLQIADGLVYFTTAGHVIMCASEPHVEYDADGKINGDLSYITIIDQSGNWVERKTANGVAYTMKDSVDAKVTFAQLYNSNYLPFTFAEFTGADPVETTGCTFSHTDGNITESQLFSARVESNYAILDVYVIVADSQGTMVHKHAVRNPNSFAKYLRMAQSGSNVDSWGTLKSGTYSVRVEAQLGTGERPVIYTGTLTVS